MTEHPKLPQGWELASLGNHAADTGGRALQGWPRQTLPTSLSGFRVVEVPVTYYPRIGKSKIGGTLKGTLSAPWFILSLMIQ
jgi:hypothetical protein